MKDKHILLVIALLVLAVPVFAQSPDDFNVFQLQDGTLAITGVKNIGNSITIPARLFGMRVSVINNNAFTPKTWNDSRGRSITISEGINWVGDRAFYSYLQSWLDKKEKIVINLPSTLRSIGIEAFSTSEVLYFGEKFDYDMAQFYNPNGDLKYEAHTFIKSLVIPRSVEKVGIGAFNYMAIDYLKIESAFSISIPNNKNYLNKSTTCVFSDSSFKSIELPGGLTDVWLRNVFSSGKDYMYGFINFYISQGRKAGIYLFNGRIWTVGTRQDVERILAATTDKSPSPAVRTGVGTTRDPEFQRQHEEANANRTRPVLPPGLVLPDGRTAEEHIRSSNTPTTSSNTSQTILDNTKDFRVSGNTIEQYFGTQKDIVIPSVINGVMITSIGKMAFSENQLPSVTIGANIMIGEYAFSNIKLPNTGFVEFYEKNKRKAGTYTYDGKNWSYSPK